MITISLCMIVKNEEDVIERCLSSVKDIADEIIIVDTGSIDRTKEIAFGFTDKIFDFTWVNDFSAARNFSFEQASMEYIMWLDADDIILPEDITRFSDLKKSMLSEVDAVMMKYNTGFDKQGRVTFSYFRERLSKRSRNFKWREPVHEYLEFGGNIINSDICITHGKQHKEENTRNIQIYENLMAEGKPLSPRGMYYYARELKEHEKYDEAAKLFSSFLDLGKGWVEDNIAACGEMARCYMALNKPTEALNSMLQSFHYDIPRAEICCQLGYYFKELNNYKLAVYWFESVLNLEKSENNWGFSQDDCWGYIPCIECAVCYDRLGDYKKAESYNDMAFEYKPDSPAVLYNKQYFDSKLGKI